MSDPEDSSRPLEELPAEGDLALARRLDWRFLLPDPDLRDAVVLGRPDPRLLEALARFGGSAHPGVDPNGAADAGFGLSSFHATDSATGTTGRVVVAIRPTLAELRTAARRVEPGGTLYAELEGPLAGPRHGGPLFGRLWAARRTVRAEGLTAALSWHWPSLAAATEIVLLDDGRVVSAAMGRHRGRRLPGPAFRAAGLLARMGLLPALLGGVSLLARRPGGAAPVDTGAADDASRPGASALAILGREAAAAILDSSAATLVLTPRYRASRHVIGLVVGGRSSAPRAVVKVPRLAHDSWGLQHERDALRALANGPGGAAPGTPKLLGYGARWGTPWLAEAALDGRPLTRRDVFRDRDATAALVRAWVATLPVRGSPADIERLVFGRLDALDDVIGSGGGHGGLSALVARTRLALEPLRASRLPAVVEHRDLAPPNLLVLADGTIGVVDWELAEPDGLPLADLAFFLGWVASAGRDVAAAEVIAADVEEALLDRQGWARPALRIEAARLGIPDETVDRLLVAVWPRALMSLARRTGPRPDLVAWLAAHRYAAIWRRALARIDGGVPG